MTQEEKELVLKDLCARLPYGAFVQFEVDNQKTIKPLTIDFLGSAWIGFIKPYLRPMSSMTKEEKDELESICSLYAIDNDCNEQFGIEILSDYCTAPDEPFKELDWLNAHHFDYHRLIEKGLALLAPEGMYDNKSN